jgi:hypothetical protein
VTQSRPANHPAIMNPTTYKEGPDEAGMRIICARFPLDVRKGVTQHKGSAYHGRDKTGPMAGPTYDVAAIAASMAAAEALKNLGLA